MALTWNLDVETEEGKKVNDAHAPEEEVSRVADRDHPGGVYGVNGSRENRVLEAPPSPLRKVGSAMLIRGKTATG